jgi:hypothetical protein
LLLALVLGLFMPGSASADRIGDSIHARLASRGPTQYFFRGILQTDKGLIGQAESELRVDLYDGEKIKFGIPVGFWLSLHPGDKAKTGLGPAAWYESRISGGGALTINELNMDGRIVIYSSPNGSFEDVYELRSVISYDDRSLFAGEDTKAIFLGLAPQLTLAYEVQGARDGAESGVYGELQLAPTFHILEGVALAADFAFPMQIGVSLGDYYEVANSAGAVEDHFLGFAAFGGVLDIDARFVPKRLGRYNLRLSLDGILPLAANEAAVSRTDTLELVFAAETVLRF